MPFRDIADWFGTLSKWERVLKAERRGSWNLKRRKEEKREKL